MQEQPTFLESLTSTNVFRKFAHLLEAGWYIHPDTKKFTPGFPGIDWRRNWIFTNPDPVRTCDLYHETFKALNFVPERCLGCWKVVVKLPSVDALIKVWNWQKGFVGSDVWCKCGIEERPYVTYQYGAYFYCDSKEQGIERHAKVVEGLQGVLGAANVKTTTGAYKKGKTEVILKRYCTEFEVRLGPTDQYKRPETSDVWEQRIKEVFDVSKINVVQPDYLVEEILLRWLEFAYDRGDQTALDYNGGKPFYPQVVTYNGKDK